MAKMVCPDKIPEWLQRVAPDATVNVRDLKNLFGYANSSSFRLAIKQGNFPEADWRAPGLREKANSTLQWKAATIIEEIKRRRFLPEDRNHTRPMHK
jgi:hypothetical protein